MTGRHIFSFPSTSVTLAEAYSYNSVARNRKFFKNTGATSEL